MYEIFESVQVPKKQVEISILGDDPLTGNPKDIVLLKMMQIEKLSVI